MPDPNPTQPNVSVGEQAACAPAAPDRPAEAPKRSAWLDALEILLNHPAGRKIALLTAAAVFFFLAFALHHFARWLLAEKPRGAGESSPPAFTLGLGDDEAAPPTRVKLVIPADILGQKGRKKAADEVEGEPVRPVNGGRQPAPGVREPERPRVPRPPAKYLASQAVGEDISLNHPDAVASRAQILTRGFNNLPDGARAWVVRRFSAEAKAYADAVAAGWQKFQDLGYQGRLLLAGKQQFDVMYARLGQAQAKLQGPMTDAECVWVLEQLKTAPEFLLAFNRRALRPTPVTVPDFTESPNPAWLEWWRRYGDQQQPD